MSDTEFDRRSFYYGKNDAKLEIKSRNGLRRRRGRKNYADFQHLLWHTDKLEILYYCQRKNDRLYLEKNRIPKFYRCSIKELELYKTVLSLKEFLVITAEKQIQSFTIHRDSWICYPDYSKVDIAEILKLELMPKLYSLLCFPGSTNYTNNVIKKLSLLQLQTKLSCLRLDINTTCPNFKNDINKNYLFKFLKNNAEKNKKDCIVLTSGCNEMNSDLKKIVQKWKNEITL